MILNTGDVPNIYEPDEKAEITEQVTASKYLNTEINKYAIISNTYFTQYEKCDV